MALMRQPFADGAGKIRIAEHTDPPHDRGAMFTAGNRRHRDRLRNWPRKSGRPASGVLRHGCAQGDQADK